MASFTSFGLDDLSLSLEQLAELPADVETEMLQAAGAVLQEGQRQELEELGLVESRALKRSISVRVLSKNGRRRVIVYPAGERSGTEQTNNDVGFVLEFGAPDRGIPAYQWMRSANAKSEERAVEAAAAVYRQWLDSLGL